MHRKYQWLMVMLMVLALLVAACGGEDSADNGASAVQNAEVSENESDVAAPSAEEEENSLDLSAANNTDGVNFDNLDAFGPKQVVLVEQQVAAGQGALLIDIQMPEGYKLNNLAPQRVTITIDGEAVSVPTTWQDYSAVEPPLPLVVPLTLSEGQATLYGDLSIYWCEAIKEELCFIDDAQLTVPITVVPSGETREIVAAIQLIPPEPQ